MAELVGTSKANVAGRLAARLAAAPSGSATSPAGQGQEVESVQGLLRQLERHIGAECPRCGEMVVKMIDRPLVTEGEEEAASWAIVPN